MDRELNLGKTCTNIIKKFLSRDVATQCTASKKIDGKKLIKTTRFMESILGNTQTLNNVHIFYFYVVVIYL